MRNNGYIGLFWLTVVMAAGIVTGTGDGTVLFIDPGEVPAARDPKCPTG